MPSVLAIVSKAIFERDAKMGGRVAAVGDTVGFDRYVSKNKGLAPVAEGGALFLVTVRPPDESLWLVAILESPKFDGENWIAPKNTCSIADISLLKDKIKFANASGISAKKGALGMSLQTPRVLSDDDVSLLRGAVGDDGGAKGSSVPLSANGHINAHEPGGVAPCLCYRCIADAPETFVAQGLAMRRDRAETKGRIVWYWYPESLEAEKDALRRSVESRIHSRANASRRHYDDLDATLAHGGDDDE